MNREAVIQLVQLLLGGGLVGYVVSLVRDRIRISRQKGREPVIVESLHLQNADASILAVARARDELEEDNARLRMALNDERAQHAQERVQHAEERRQWHAEREAMRGEITGLENRLRELLDELTDVRARHGL